MKNVSHKKFHISLCGLALLLGSAESMAMGAKAPTVPTTPTPPVRVLKKRVELGNINVFKFQLPDGTSFDLGTAIDAQFLSAVLASNAFVVKASQNNTPGTLSVDGNGKLQFAALSVDPPSDVPACEVDIPQLHLEGDVIGYEFSSKTGITLGYSPGQTMGKISVSTSVDVATSRLYMIMRALHPLSEVPLASTQIDGKQNEVTINAKIDFSVFPIDLNYYLKTPLAKVSLNALTMGVSDILKQVAALDWAGSIAASENDLVSINGGSQSGVHVGDRFVVQNVHHLWSGEPCKSNYQNITTDKVATVEVISMDESFCSAKVIERYSSDPILVGGRVTIESLAK